MAWSLDARIPVEFPEALPDAGAAWAWVGAGRPAGAAHAVAFDPEAARHQPECACCAGRSPAAEALDLLFQARVRGACPWFARVAVAPGLADTVRAAMVEDAVTAARFRAA